jgi:hypothetical protein
MRSSDVRGLLIYCADYKCAHAVRISADRWPDHIRLFPPGDQGTRSFAHNFTGSAGSVSQSFIELPWTKQHVLQPFAHSFTVDSELRGAVAFPKTDFSGNSGSDGALAE